MLNNLEQENLDNLIPKILHMLSSDPDSKFEAEEIAERLKTGLEEVNRCLEQMSYLKLIDLHVAFGPRYLAQVTAMGLANKDTKFGAGVNNYE